MILRAPDQIDWGRLYRIGVARGQGFRLRDALEYLRRFLGTFPPLAVQAALDQQKPPVRERVIHACTARSVPGLGSFPRALAGYLGATTGRTAYATAAGLPWFFRGRWQVERAWHLPVAGGRRVVRNVGRRPADPTEPE